MDFAERVKNVRIELKLSQEDLAHKLGVGFATINKWENDSYSKHLFFSIEKAERLNARLILLFAVQIDFYAEIFVRKE